MEKSEIVAEL